MSFGFSIGDLVALIALTKKTYDGWRDAPREYKDVVRTLSESKTLLCHVERRFDALTGAEHGATRQKEIGDLLDGCQKTISELRLVVKRRRRLGHWERLRLGAGAKHVNDCKDRLSRHIAILTPFLFSLELESIGKDIGSIPATLDRLPQALSNALPAALGKMIDQRIEDSRTARGSIMTTYGDDDDKQAYKELRRNLRYFGIKDSVVRQQRSKLVEFIKTLTHDDQDPMVESADGGHQVSEVQNVPIPSMPVLVPQVLHAAEDTETVCAEEDASTTSHGRYQAYAETEDEDEHIEVAVNAPSNADTATRSEKVERHAEDVEHRTNLGGNAEDETKDETEGARGTGMTPSGRESPKDATERRKYQAYVESESEDDDLNTSWTASDEYLAPPLRSRSSQPTRAGSVQRGRSIPSDLDHDMPGAKPDVKSPDSDIESNASGLSTGSCGYSGPSDGHTKANRVFGESDRPFAPRKRRSTSAVCGDREYQKCLGSESGSESIHAVAGTHVSCDSNCSLCDLRQDSEGSDDSWDHLSGGDGRWSDSRQRSEVDDFVSKVAHSGGTDGENGCSDKRYIWRPKPSRCDTSTNSPRRDLDSPSSYSSSSSSSSFASEVERAKSNSGSPQRLIEYHPLDAKHEGRLTIQLHMPAGYSIHVEGGRVAQFQDRLMPPTCRQYFPALPPYEEYEEYQASCLHGFPSARQLGHPKKCRCQVVYWTPELQAWNPNFVDGLRKWVMDEGVRKTSWDGRV